MLLAFFCPEWLKQDQKVTILKDDIYKNGHLNINKDVIKMCRKLRMLYYIVEQ